MNKVERIKMIKAMEFIARQINDEEALGSWLINGVPDGDIEYGDLDVQIEDGIDLSYWIDNDKYFGDLMDSFLFSIRRAALVCDNVPSADFREA